MSARWKVLAPSGKVHYAREREWVSGVRRTYCGLRIGDRWTYGPEAERDCQRCIATADAEDHGRRTMGRMGGL